MKRAHNVWLMTLISIIITSLFVISTTSAKYVSLEYGNILNVNFSRFTSFAEEFIIGVNGTYDEETGVYESDELWGAEDELGNGSIQQWAPDYKIDKLNEIAFKVRNGTPDVIALSAFVIEIYLFQSSKLDLTFTIQNTATQKAYEHIQGYVTMNKYTITSNKQFNTTVTKVSGKQYGIVLIEINPLEYYKNVVLENNVLDIETDDNTVTTEEKANLEKNYVLRPGQVFEFNVSIDLGAITGATNHSVYSMVKMKAEKYV